MQNIIATTPGEFVSGSVIGTASACKSLQTKTGKTIFKCTITDGPTVVDCTSFVRSFHELEGKRIEIKGRGIRRGDDYNGKICIVVGDKAVFSINGEAMATQTPAQATEPLKTEGKAIAGPSRVEGVTVGMAINKAVDLSIAQGKVSEENIWHYASMLIRLSAKLQSGQLAPESPVETEEIPY